MEPRPLERAVARLRSRVGAFVGALGLRARLMLLVVGLAAPFIAFIATLAWTQAVNERAEALGRAGALARLATTRADEFLDRADATLRVLGRDLGGRESAAWQAEIDALRTDLPEHVDDLVAWSKDGTAVASLDPQVLVDVNVATRPFFREALRSGGLAIEAPVPGLGRSDPVVVVARAIVDRSGRLAGVVSQSTRLHALGSWLLRNGALPAGLVVTVAAPDGTVLARSVDPALWIGRTIPADAPLARDVREGSAETVGLDGVARLTGVATVARANWRVYAGMPTRTALAPRDAQLRAITILGVAALLVGVALAAIGANGITTRLSLLADDAARLEAGELGHRSVVPGHDEVGVLGNALNRMADALQQRSEALTRKTDELAQITANVPVLIAYVDANRRYRFANEYHRDVFGVPPESLVGRTLDELLGASYERIRPRIAEVLSGLPATFEASFAIPEGPPWFLVSCFPDYGDASQVRGFYAVCQDITRRRQAEEALAARERFTQLVTDTIPARITYIDTQGRVQFGNRDFARTWGIEAPFLGRPIADLVPPAVYRQIAPHLARSLAGEALHYELSTERPDGMQHDVVRYVPDIGADGTVHGVFTISQDVTAIRRSESARSESEKRMRLITDNVPAAMAYLNRHERYLFANAGFLDSFGLTLDDLVGRRVAEVQPPDVYATIKPHIDGVLAGERQRYQRVVTRLGSRRHELVEYIPEVGSDGDVSGFFALIHDVTDLHDAQVRVEASEQRLRSITENIPALICYIDRDRRYRFNSRYYEEWLGRPLSAITGRTVREVIGAETYAVDGPHIERAFGGERVDFEVEHRDERGVRYVRGSYVPDVDASGQVVGIYGATTDVTSLKAVEKQLERLAQFDALTGLPNRNQFNVRIAGALARIARSGLSVGLLFIDIDGFKRVNDSRGHAAGDALLREFGARLAAAVRETDTVARLAGDEFVVILDGVHRREECQFIARKIVATMRRPMRIGHEDVVVTTSIGVAMTDDSATAPEQLLQKADAALYVAKAQGRDRYEVAI